MGSFFRGIRRNWSKHFISQITAIFILSITYGTALFTVFSSVSIKEAIYTWGKVGEATVYLKAEVPDGKIETIRTSIGQRPFIKKVEYISPKASAENFKVKYQGLFPTEVKKDNLSPFFPSSFHIHLRRAISTEAGAQSMKRFGIALKSQFSEVEEVSFGQTWLYRYTKVLDLFENIALWVGVILLIASLFVTSNVLRTVLYSRKQEIEILEMVGATPFWIFAPHVLNALFICSVSFLCALLINSYVFAVASKELSVAFDQLILQKFGLVSHPILLLIMSSGLLIAVFCSTLITVHGLKESHRKPFRLSFRKSKL